jgi:hypothetical protein
MTKRGKHDHLSECEKERLRQAILRGVNTHILAHQFNISERTVAVHKAKMEGRVPCEQGFRATHFPRHPFCRHGDCMEEGTGKPPYCDAHRPPPRQPVSIPWSIPLSRLMARRA